MALCSQLLATIIHVWGPGATWLPPGCLVAPTEEPLTRQLPSLSLQALNKDPDRTEPATKEEIARALGMPLPRLLQLLRLARAPRLADRGGGDITATVMSASMKVRGGEEGRGSHPWGREGAGR